ncbi:MAG: MauE/DoxX family redox-associated membrane protein [Nakamurella sp.]
MRPIVPVAGLAAVLAVPGVAHFTHPAPFVSIVPRSLPRPELLVAASGVAELACAGLIAHPRTRRIGGLGAAALFVAVFPANVSMALRSGDGPMAYRVMAWARLPLQIPLIGWALAVSRR